MFLAVCLLLLSACKIKIIVPPGGKVISDSGVECRSGATCVIEVNTETYDDTFTAVPDPGYVFKHWRKNPNHFCGQTSEPCHLYTTTFRGHEALLAVLASNRSFFLKPVFVNNSGYKLAYWKKAVQDIELGSFASNQFLYVLQPNVAQCDPGVLSEKAGLRAQAALNQLRALHKLPAVQYDAFYDMEIQATSLVQRANQYINHFPATTDRCYTASAATGSSTSNLSLGPQTDPASDVFGWANDNQNVAKVKEAGHRRWLLYPTLGYTSYGQVEGFSAMKILGFGQPPQTPVNTAVEYVAFPHNSYPSVLVSQGPNPTPWSISMVPPSGVSDRFDYFASAGVKVSDRETGAQLPVHSVHHDTKGFGLGNFLSWQVDNWEYDRAYDVSISAVSMPDGNSRNIDYSVLVDRYNLVNLHRPLESGDGKKGERLQGRFNSPVDQDSYQISLANTVSFSGRSEFQNQAFYVRLYDDRKRLIKSEDEAFTTSLSPGVYTVIVSPCNENGRCYQQVETYTVDFQ